MVQRCSCGAVHVTIGAVTLRLAACTLAPIAATLGDAARALAFELAPDRNVMTDRVVS